MNNTRGRGSRFLTPADAAGRAYWSKYAQTRRKERRADQIGSVRPISGDGLWRSKQRFFGGATLDLRFDAKQFKGSTAALLEAGFTRASVAYADVDGMSWVPFAAGKPRYTKRGLLMEETRTNSIRNNSMTGAALGTPGTMPTNWSILNPSGLSTSVVGLGTEYGVDYIDIRMFGTPNATQSLVILSEALSNIAATNGQLWSNSAFLKIVAGAPTNTIGLTTSQRDGTSFLADLTTNFTVTNQLTRFEANHTTNQATIAFISPRVSIGVVNGTPMDLTLRIGWPQLELGAMATSPIRTTGSALARAADALKLTGAALTSWWTAQAAGTLFAEFQSFDKLGTNNNCAVSLDDNTTNNRIQIRRLCSTGTSSCVIVAAAAVQVNQGGGVVGAYLNGARAKTELAYNTNDVQITTKGSNGVAVTTATIPTALTQLQIGSGPGVAALNGYLSRLAYFNSRIAAGPCADTTL